MAREMKDSGVKWVGEIPYNWQILPNKYIMHKIKEICPIYNGEDILSLSVKGVNVRDLDAGGKMPATFNGYQKLHKGHLLMCLFDMDVTPCCIGRINNEGLTSPAYSQFVVHKGAHRDYYYYYYLMLDNTKELVHLAKNLRHTITEDQLGNIKIPLPPFSEQQAIADFLDAKCAEIDGLLADLDAEVKTLAEYKKSIIAETVTRGLNPNAPMKQSGIPWAETIPAHWNLHPVYHYFSQRVHKNIFGNEQNLLSLSFGKIIRKDINTVGGLLPASYNTYNIVEANDIIIRPTDLQNDKRSLRTGLVTEHGIITSAYIALKPNSNIHSPYFHYLLHSYDIKKVFYNMGNGVRQGLNYSEFSRLMLFEPPIDEQQAIAAYLDKKCAIIDQSIADKQTQIETLKSYKASLIYEYVTGKKQVI